MFTFRSPKRELLDICPKPNLFSKTLCIRGQLLCYFYIVEIVKIRAECAGLFLFMRYDMEDIKIDESKLNIDNSLPNVPRLPDGKIDLDAVSLGKNEKGDYIVSDEVFNAYYKELPVGTRNQNQSAWTTKNGGIFKMPTEDIRRKGADSLNARLAERKTNKEILEEIARQLMI